MYQILVVDDERIERNGIKMLLRHMQLPCEIAEAANGRDALEYLNEHTSDVLLTDVKMPYGAMDFRMMSRQMVDSILELSEVQRFSKGIFSWVGFNTKWIAYKTVDRQLGQTTWKFSSLFKYAIEGITSFSVAPLRFTAVMGFIIFVISLIYIIITLIQTLFLGITTPGYVTTLCAILFMGGITEMSIGILGEYIGKIYMEAKDRPIYITKFSNFEDEDNEEKDDKEING